MIAHKYWPRAFGGAPLEGERLMRIVYLDESGIGKIEHDPILVVSGVIIHADAHWLKLQAHLRRLLEDATPQNVPVPSNLHAKDIWHGAKEFHRDQWPRAVRMELLDELAKIPVTYDLPVVWAALGREKYQAMFAERPAEERPVDVYSIASMICFIMAEEYMRLKAPPDEVATVVFESNSRMQKRIPAMHAFATNPKKMAALTRPNDPYFPITRIIDTPTFQAKSQSSILQLADFCAFAIKRYEQGAAGADGWYEMLKAQFVRAPLRPALMQ